MPLAIFDVSALASTEVKQLRAAAITWLFRPVAGWMIMRACA
jgi:hypothetical protein